MVAQVVDYDAEGYDYRDYWRGRDYEWLAEYRALRRLVPRLGRPRWLVDLGGGFGRNAVHYRGGTGRYVIVDYSATNLAHAAELLAGDVAAGRGFLVRADLNALPFVDAGLEAGLLVRVLHHLPDLGRTLTEMARVVGGSWLVDVPIKHHALGVARGLLHGNAGTVLGPEPMRTGGAQPFHNFQLAAVRAMLAERGFRTTVAASVNNLRRWDRRLPSTVVRALHPAAELVEASAQRWGTGWWEPNQFVVADRPAPVTVPGVPPLAARGTPAVAALMACPSCRGPLSWSPEAAVCRCCPERYTRVRGYWDFTAPIAVGRRDGLVRSRAA